MARTYQITGGIKTLVPTERQMAKLEAIKQRTFADPNGNAENSLFTDKGAREYLIDWAKTQDPAYLAKLIRDGIMNEDYVKAMWLRNYLDRKKGFMPDDLNNPNSPWNLKLLESIYSAQKIENGAIWDKFNTFIGCTSGTSTEVALSHGEGMLVGGTILHNHPRQTFTGLGGGFSVRQEGLNKGEFAGDFIVFKNTGAARMLAAAPEGTYELSAPRTPNYSTRDLKILQSEVSELSKQTISKYRNIKGSFSNGMYARADAIGHFELLRDFARRHGCTYEFRPNKGYENLLDRSSLTKQLPPLLR